MQSLFVAMFLACSAGVLIFLVSVFRKRDTMAPDAESHDAFLGAQDVSPWLQAAAALGLSVEVDEPEVLLCRHVLQGEVKGRLVRLQTYDRKHAGRLGHPSAVRVGVQQELPALGVDLEGGGSIQKVHGVLSVCFDGARFLGEGLNLGRAARPIRQDGPWIELDGRCDPGELGAFLEQALAVFSKLERASHQAWVRAAQDHGLRLEWERERRVPRLAGLVDGVGVRGSWVVGGGARIRLLRGAQSPRPLRLPEGLPVTLQEGEGLVFTVAPAEVEGLSEILGAVFQSGR